MRSSLPHVGTIAALGTAVALLVALVARLPGEDASSARLAAAESEVADAYRAGALWLHTRERLAAARRALAAGDATRAVQFSAAAETEARLALEQHALETARYRQRRARELGMTPPPALETALAHRDARAAAAAAAQLGPLP